MTVPNLILVKNLYSAQNLLWHKKINKQHIETYLLLKKLSSCVLFDFWITEAGSLEPVVVVMQALSVSVLLCQLNFFYYMPVLSSKCYLLESDSVSLTAVRLP